MGFQSDQTKYQDPNQLEQEHTIVSGHVGAKQGQEEPIPGRPAGLIIVMPQPDATTTDLQE